MSKKIKILQFPIANSYGGITHYAINNWFHMDKSRFECDFATMSKELSFANEVTDTGAKIFYLSDYPSNNRELFVEEFNRILDNGYDVVHLHTAWWKDYLVEELCRERGIKKVIVHAHNTSCDIQDENRRRLNEFCHNQVKKAFSESMATDFWACSKMAADWLFGPQIPTSKILIMHNAICVEDFLFNKNIRELKRCELGLSKDDIVIGNVGRLCFQKNQEMLIRAYADAFGDKEHYILFIIGDGSMMKELSELAQSLKIDKRVRFLGHRNDVNLIYQALDIFALTSRFEGLPISAIEAQCSGLKCLINSTITNEVDITQNCVWVDDTISDWSNKLIKYAVPYERRNMREALTLAGYDIGKQIKIIEEMYEK